jgi:NAD(P)-dependent dehydrogenase (short-subunit alcohol dehydrogenase family)
MHVAITGASSGIGAAFAREWARRGAALTLIARRGDLLRKLAAETGGKVRCVEADMGERAMAEVETALKGSAFALSFARSVPWGTADVLARRVADAVAERRPRVIYPRFYAFQRWLPPFARWANDLVTPAPPKIKRP